MRRRRSDTLPLVAQPLAPRVVVVGFDVDQSGELHALIAASELVGLEPSPLLATTIAEKEPDLVFLRATAETLPLVRELKLLPETHFIPIIACGAAETRMPAFAAGADHWTPLPLPAEEIKTRAAALLRTAALSRALKQSRQELRLRRDWVRYLVHDLRNLLTKAIGDLNMASRRAEAEPAVAVDLMVRCEEELWRCSSLLNDLIDVDRIRKGMLNVRRAPTDLVALAGNAVEAFAAAARRGRVDVVIRHVEPAVMAEADRELVERVIANLLSNALRYAPEETPIEVDVRREADHAVIEITNRGPSIPPDKIDEIFEPFVKAEEGPQAAGSGLGLAFCRLTVEMHGGKITVGQPEGGGARFRVELPASASTS